MRQRWEFKLESSPKEIDKSADRLGRFEAIKAYWLDKIVDKRQNTAITYLPRRQYVIEGA
jgi:hypothetical protein